MPPLYLYFPCTIPSPMMDKKQNGKTIIEAKAADERGNEITDNQCKMPGNFNGSSQKIEARFRNILKNTDNISQTA